MGKKTADQSYFCKDFFIKIKPDYVHFIEQDQPRAQVAITG